MRRFVCVFILITAIIYSVVSDQRVLANVFANRLSVSNPDSSEFDGDLSDGSGALLSFFLNDTASSVLVDIIDFQTQLSVFQIDAGPMSHGANSVIWDGTGSQNDMFYVFEVTAIQPNVSNIDWTVFYDSGDINIFTRGVSVVQDQPDPWFGLIFTSNDGGPLGTGIGIYNSDGSFHDPFLVAADMFSGGSIDYGTEAPLFAILDSLGRIFVSNKDLGQIMRINRDFSAQVIIDGLTQPKGLYLKGKGEDFTIYVAADNQILRANVGTAETFPANSMELLAEFSGFYPHQIMLDDDGALYTTLRASNDLGSDGKGIRKFDISGNLPVADDDAVWFLFETKTFIANDLMLDRGADLNSSSDDILYYVTRAGDSNDQDGIWRINDINAILSVDTVRIITEQAFYGANDNVQARATIDFDPAGNIVFMENANEHVFLISPPGEGETNSYTTRSPDTIMVDIATAIAPAHETLSQTYKLAKNYPNPFNPTTTIEFQIPEPEQVKIEVFNTGGQRVATLLNERVGPGVYKVHFDAKKWGITSGVYFYRLTAGDFSAVEKMVLTK
jgi:hypothetical protein